MFDKKYYFLSGLPRCGNTLLSSILGQNSKIKVSPNSFLSTIFCQILDQDDNIAFHNFPDYQSLQDCASILFKTYYKSWNGDIIIDRAPWGTEGNLKILKDYCPNKPKFICPYRPLVEILASFINLYHKNKIIDISDKRRVEDICYGLMGKGGLLYKSIQSINNLHQSEHDVYYLNYHSLCENPQNEVRNIYKFLGLKQHKHNFKNIDQFEVNGVKYHDEINDSYKNLHDVRPIIKEQEINVDELIPPSIIKEYKHLNFEYLTSSNN
tara:strand:+ start:876 stop:1676 length:801 start_codon:yes stop_codon:yes gene_type:complete